MISTAIHLVENVVEVGPSSSSPSSMVPLPSAHVIIAFPVVVVVKAEVPSAKDALKDDVLQKKLQFRNEV